MKRYTKKPVTVEAIQWTGENYFKMDQKSSRQCK